MTRKTLLTAVAIIVCLAASTQAETRRYALDLPAGHSAAYELVIEPAHEGTMIVSAEWAGNRLLSIKVEPPPGGGITLRRNGASPQKLELQVTRAAIRHRDPWKLTLRSFAGREPASGVLTVMLPEPEPVKVDRLPEPVVEVDPWSAWQMPPEAAPAWREFDRAAHALRRVLDAENLPDVCRWQAPLLDYLDNMRQSLIDENTPPAASTRIALERIVEAVDAIEAMRQSKDPFISGPIPEDSNRRHAFLRIRRQRLAPLENQLDTLLTQIGGDHSPELGKEKWPVRFVSCATACERHFDELSTLGPERASNADIARDQWERIREAARTLTALAVVE